MTKVWVIFDALSGDMIVETPSLVEEFYCPRELEAKMKEQVSEFAEPQTTDEIGSWKAEFEIGGETWPA